MKTSTLITLSGMIGSGKTTLSKVISERFGLDLYEEPVDSPILKQFYLASQEEQAINRYPFLLQLDFLASRYHILQTASDKDVVAVIDRSLQEDYHFAKVNTDIGNIRPIEFEAYERVFNTMMDEVGITIHKTPLVLVYLEGSFETVLHRIQTRGRDFEMGDELVDYYYRLWSGYKEWIDNYEGGRVYRINIDEVDVLNKSEDCERVLKEIEEIVNEQVKDDAKKIHLLP